LAKMSSQGHFRHPTCPPSCAESWNSAPDFDPISPFVVSLHTFSSHLLYPISYYLIVSEYNLCIPWAGPLRKIA
jgi:hypothetical protein